MKRIVAWILAATAWCGAAWANEGGPAWDKFPKERVTDMAALQNGARLFVNYCLNCHPAAFMRYNRLRDIGLTDEQIKRNLVFAGEKVGELMTVAMTVKDAKEWFGAAPPDLTVVARSRAGANGSGADYLYTYMRSFYRDESRPTGWNNLLFPNVGMPHVLWQLQGEQRLQAAGPEEGHTLVLDKPGTMSPAEYDVAVADLVNYLVFMGEPAKTQRIQLGFVVLLFLFLFFVVALYLKQEFWKDIH